MPNPRQNPQYKNKEIKLSSSDHWRTPDWLFNKLNEEFDFEVDLAADKDNTKLRRFYSLEDNALNHEWTENSFGNIPYSNPSVWFQKAWEDSVHYQTTIVLLVRVDPANNYWVQYCRHAHVRFLAGRIKFWDDNNQPHYSAKWSSAVIIFSPETHNNPKTEYWDYRGEEAIKLY